MKNMKRILSIAISLLLLVTVISVPATAATVFESDGFYYSRTGSSTADLPGRSSTDAEMVIPKEFSEYYVTNIVDSAFESDQNLETVYFGDATLLERIGYYAFKNCINLSGDITFAGRISTIGTSAFEDCHSLENVVFNAYVKDIPDQCFYNCYALKKVVMNDRIESIGKFAFANCTSLKEITIPASVTSISKTAFNGDEGLVISCYTDSAAHQYAVDNGFEYILLDAPEPTEPPTDPPTDAPTEAPTDPATDPATEKPSTVPTEVTFILGDADGDGSISILDATKIQRVLASIDPDDDGMITLRGNVNNAKELNILHATKIQRFIAGYEVAEPIGAEVTRTIQVPVE